MRMFTCVTAVTLAACGGDLTSATGELGMLTYTLYTDYEVPEGDLTNAKIVAGHRQSIAVAFTEDGRDEGKDKGEAIEHRVSPAEGTTLTNHGAGKNTPPSFDITVANAGHYTFEAMLDGEVFDRIKLSFDTVSSFDLLLQKRDPYAERFDVIDDRSTISIVEGTQITIDTAPLNATGARLAGRVETYASIDPRWCAVPGVGVVESYEGEVWKTSGQANFYFIEEYNGAVLTVLDDVSGASGSATFDITVGPRN